ncbi:hypothetical protein FRC10_005823, partial [Ceratobasidium sp. 414]
AVKPDQEWYNRVVCKQLGHHELQPWQLDGIVALREGKDVFVIAPTGAGKSTVIQGAVLADRASGLESVAVVLVPTKCLANDQARALNKNEKVNGLLRGLALHADAVSDANCQHPPRKIFEEIQAGKWTHVFIGPEIIMHPAFGALINNDKFCARLRYFVVDEAHMTIEWREFRDAFADVARLRNRFRRKVPWLALSATVEPRKEFTKLADSLGFRLAATTILRLPVDRPNLTYSPRFIQHACSEESTEFLDLSFVIPWRIERIEDIPTTVIFATHVKHVMAIAEYLTRLLPATISREARNAAVIPMDGMMSTAYNARAVERLGRGNKTRILVCTDTGALGIDISQVKRSVILVDKGATYRMLCQKAGRVRAAGQAIFLFPRWMDYARTSSTDVKNRSGVEAVILEFANATVKHCPRVVNTEYWGDEGVPSAAAGRPCCNRHNPEVDLEDIEAVKERVKMKGERKGQAASLRSDGTHPPLDETMVQPIVRMLFVQWRQVNLKDSVEFETYHPPSTILPDHLIRLLAEKLHLCTTFERFCTVMSSWGHLEEFGELLFELVGRIWVHLRSEVIAQKISKIQEQRQKEKKKRVVGGEETPEGHVTESSGVPKLKRQKKEQKPRKCKQSKEMN